MMDQVINTYFSNIPMVLCTDGAFVAAGNPAACARLKHCRRESLCLNICPPLMHFALKLPFDCVSQEVSVFPLKGYHGFRYAVAVFQKTDGTPFCCRILVSE